MSQIVFVSEVVRLHVLGCTCTSTFVALLIDSGLPLLFPLTLDILTEKYQLELSLYFVFKSLLTEQVLPKTSFNKTCLNTMHLIYLKVRLNSGMKRVVTCKPVR